MSGAARFAIGIVGGVIGGGLVPIFTATTAAVAFGAMHGYEQDSLQQGMDLFRDSWGHAWKYGAMTGAGVGFLKGMGSFTTEYENAASYGDTKKTLIVSKFVSKISQYALVGSMLAAGKDYAAEQVKHPEKAQAAIHQNWIESKRNYDPAKTVVLQYA